MNSKRPSGLMFSLAQFLPEGFSSELAVLQESQNDGSGRLHTCEVSLYRPCWRLYVSAARLSFYAVSPTRVCAASRPLACRSPGSRFCVCNLPPFLKSIGFSISQEEESLGCADEENCTGRVNQNVAPCPGRLWTPTSPCWRWIRCRHR